MLYGASVYGVPTTTLKAIRGFACAVRGEMRGRSTFARLELARYDPGAGGAVAPIVDWANAIWDSVAPQVDLELVWKRAHSLIGNSPTPFRHVAGPGSAMLASCLRIGWKIPRYNTIMMADGTLIDMTSTCPMQVQKHAIQELRWLEANSSSLAARLGGPPDLEPLSDYLATKKVASSQAAFSLRALGEGGWWSQSRLHQEGRVEDPWCKACGDRGGLGQALGTLHHRMVACSATEGIRKSFKNQALMEKAQSALHGGKPLFQQGVPVLVRPSKVPKHELSCCGGRQLPPDFTASGYAFTDGAMRFRAPKSARRAGWAWVVVDEQGQVIFGLYGPCPDPFPTAFRAELRAVCELLVLAVPPLTIWIDNSEVIQGWKKGRQWCCSSARSAADLWRVFWHRLEDIGEEGIELRKTKGHATEVDVQQGRSTDFERAGNEHADHFAGRGVDAALHQSPNQAEVLAYKEATGWYKWLSLLCSHWPKDVDPQPKGRLKRCELPKPVGHQAKRRRQKGPELLLPSSTKCRVQSSECRVQEEGRRAQITEYRTQSTASTRCRVQSSERTVQEEGHRAQITECRTQSTEPAARRKAEETKEAAKRRRLEESEEVEERRRAEEGKEAAERRQRVSDLVDAKQLHPSHSIRLSGSLVWCYNCGCYGQERIKSLKLKCSGPSKVKSKAGQLAQMKKGRHPLTGQELVMSSSCKPSTHRGASKASSSSAAPAGGLAARATACPDAAEGAKRVCLAVSKPLHRVVGQAFGRLAAG